MQRSITLGLVALYLGAIVLANLALTQYGPAAIVPDAFFLIGLDFVTRDKLQDLFGQRRVIRMGALIIAGGLLTYYLNRDAEAIAVASSVSFAAAELVESVVYYVLRHQPWIARAPKSAIPAAIVDSIVFPTLAFGVFAFSTSFTQFAAKLAGAFVWTLVLGLVRTRQTVTT